MRRIRLLALLACLVARPALSQASGSALPYKIPILQYHLIGDTDSRWKRSRDGFRRDLQFSYIERSGKLEIDPNSAVGIWLAFSRTHPDWKPRATFCLLPAANDGHAFFGDTGVAGQKSAWRLSKVRFLAQQGFELCNHTLWHARLDRRGDAAVQEQIARGDLAIDSAVAGYRVRTFALPLGLWPRNKALARAGAWSDPKSGRTVRYRFDAILEVTGALEGTPYGPGFDPFAIPRTQVIGDNLGKLLDAIEPKRFRPR
ncbi:MAG: polysaccharide deacetylase family protein [Gemmatimonadaceae bacterium]